MTNALVRGSTAIAPASEPGFDFTGFQIFTSVPDHREFGIVALHGMVVVYDERPLRQEGVLEGAFYVRETQRPSNCLNWEAWLRHEWDDRQSQVGPASPLTIRREVVQAVRWPRDDYWAVRLSSGFTDGPLHDWVLPRTLIGKVAGVYLPEVLAREC